MSSLTKGRENAGKEEVEVCMDGEGGGEGTGGGREERRRSDH